MKHFEALRTLTSTISKVRDRGLLRKYIRLQKGTIELIAENDKLRKELANLRKAKKSLTRMVHKKGVYFVKSDDKEDGPFCTRCFDKDRILIRLDMTDPFQATCPQCEHIVHR